MEEKFKELDSSTKDLIVKGYYSFYEATDSSDNLVYILIAENEKYYLISESGKVIKKINTLETYTIIKSICLSDHVPNDALQVNVVSTYLLPF